MTTTMEINYKETLKIWPKVAKTLSVPHNETQYLKAIQLLDHLSDIVGENEKHPLASLLETVAVLIEDYENSHLEEPKTNARGALKYLMAEHNLKQEDLPEIGSQGVVSEILNGKRHLNIKQITKLSKRFGVSPVVFCDI
ncbi:MAG: transcription regulator containing HTH protein [uncultured bacterium]|nr:MAG: transcription regulator containing HTH protein [uncultured bacterium]